MAVRLCIQLSHNIDIVIVDQTALGATNNAEKSGLSGSNGAASVYHFKACFHEACKLAIATWETGMFTHATSIPTWY